MDTDKGQDQKGQASPARQSFRAGDQLLVCLLTDMSFNAEGEGGEELIPAETRLIGNWESMQPTEPHRCRILINDAVWTLNPYKWFRLACFDPYVGPCVQV